MENCMSVDRLTAYPVRIIPFDLGRQLEDKDYADINLYIANQYTSSSLSPRQKSILKNCKISFSVSPRISVFIYENGMCVVVIDDLPMDLRNDFEHFSIPYGENRKTAHSQLFDWIHPDSSAMEKVVNELRRIVLNNTKKLSVLRKSASTTFENRGLSYIMTLSIFDVSSDVIQYSGFKKYPTWLKNNLYALLDPSILYLEDSSKFGAVNEIGVDVAQILNELDIEEEVIDYERHKHIDTYMSWAAVVLVGQIQDIDREEYTTLEIQLQSDWFYVYCIEKGLEGDQAPDKHRLIDIQKQSYDLELLQNRLLDFDDSSMPARILDVQRGLVETSGLSANINHLQRKIRFILERERLNTELKQKKLGQSSEILLFIIAFIEIAPTVAEYGDRIFPYAGLITNILVLIVGLMLLIRKD